MSSRRTPAPTPTPTPYLGSTISPGSGFNSSSINPNSTSSSSSSSNGDASGLIIGLVVALVVLLFLALLLRKSIYVVQQAEGIVIERFGGYHKLLDSGIHFIVPLIDSPRMFSWKRVVKRNGRMETHDDQQYRIDLRESVFAFPSQEVYTRDTILLDVNSIMFFRIVDVRKAVYEIDDLSSAIANVAQTQLKEVFGNMTFTEALASQSVINAHIQHTFGDRFAQWGLW
ncbi:hypothetical protein SPRG_19906 [Saprolegnia parasitica CBS 223.65]|uniref:Band 7 domain-containing protein n=1 Tax=Saprolegnia parasitica (strain CBS 223.65) TaxID=695850 RepID=A0A067CJA0_SAPPC|nr:hypothetical protein SPRG_19906 [Saprolegnia parasitica CBS 223.65]KDO29240.1 hypothetical protein SPRG_19906 [Saprolegnia parasitica CBS 223.65]|eukprot:XP_012200133.1 hypothetical protein SPRG_19906 [Saprolegnia parasitica CBS 223.65]